MTIGVDSMKKFLMGLFLVIVGLVFIPMVKAEELTLNDIVNKVKEDFSEEENYEITSNENTITLTYKLETGNIVIVYDYKDGNLTFDGGDVIPEGMETTYDFLNLSFTFSLMNAIQTLKQDNTLNIVLDEDPMLILFFPWGNLDYEKNGMESETKMVAFSAKESTSGSTSTTAEDLNSNTDVNVDVDISIEFIGLASWKINVEKLNFNGVSFAKDDNIALNGYYNDFLIDNFKENMKKELNYAGTIEKISDDSDTLSKGLKYYYDFDKSSILDKNYYSKTLEENIQLIQFNREKNIYTYEAKIDTTPDETLKTILNKKNEYILMFVKTVAQALNYSDEEIANYFAQEKLPSDAASGLEVTYDASGYIKNLKIDVNNLKLKIEEPEKVVDTTDPNLPENPSTGVALPIVSLLSLGVGALGIGYYVKRKNNIFNI